jgi:hypothetical protein
MEQTLTKGLIGNVSHDCDAPLNQNRPKMVREVVESVKQREKDGKEEQEELTRSVIWFLI